MLLALASFSVGTVAGTFYSEKLQPIYAQVLGRAHQMMTERMPVHKK